MASGRRTPARNREVGGVKNSFHLRGRAVDFHGDLRDLRSAETKAWDQRISPTCTGPEETLIEDPGGPRQHLHIAW